jgi:protein involved in polysaccharide export with SLBB domain
MTPIHLLRLRLAPARFALAVTLTAGNAAVALGQSVASESTTTAVAAATPDLSSLRAGDVLRLRIWREPDLSGDFPVDETGRAILPRLGATVVIGIPAEQLKQQLTEAYRQYLNNPSIEITPLRRIAILGAVRNPGIYPIDPSITLGEAPNVAGGTAPESKHNLIELRRDGATREVDLRRHPALARLPLASGDQVYIPERSWLSKNATWVVSTAIGVAGTTALLLTR